MPILDKVRRAILGAAPVPDDQDARCWNFRECGHIVPANRGIREQGFVFCSPTCAEENLRQIEANYY